MRVAIRRGLNRRSSATIFKLLGYSLEQLRKHLEKQFIGKMSWENMADWHVDHIIPLSSFSIKEAGDKEFLAAWSLGNLRPLFAKNNLEKRDKILTLI